MEKISRKEQKVKTKMYREMSRKTQTRLEQGPMVAEIVTQELDMLFVSMIMREYLEGPFSKRRALHKGEICLNIYHSRGEKVVVYSTCFSEGFDFARP